MIGEHESSLKRALDEFGVYLKPSSFGQDVKPLLKETCKSIFGTSAGLVDMMVQHFPSSKEGNTRKVESSFYLQAESSAPGGGGGGNDCLAPPAAGVVDMMVQHVPSSNGVTPSR